VSAEDTTGSTRSGTPAEPTPDADGTTPPDTPGPRLFGSRSRHRRPRPRKVLLAAGGLALAAGALSLVRLMPDPGRRRTQYREGDLGFATRQGHRRGPHDEHRRHLRRRTGREPVRTLSHGRPDRRTDHEHLRHPDARHAHRTDAHARNHPPATNSPAPQPSRTGGVCVPVMGLCVDPLSDGG
jgi:hypothetical protein